MADATVVRHVASPFLRIGADEVITNIGLRLERFEDCVRLGVDELQRHGRYRSAQIQHHLGRGKECSVARISRDELHRRASLAAVGFERDWRYGRSL